jgi:hypothetical protein
MEKDEVASQDDYRDNPRRALFAALKKDWKLKPKPKSTAKSDIGHGWVASAPENLVPPGSDERSRVAAGLAAWRRSEQRGATQ